MANVIGLALSIAATGVCWQSEDGTALPTTETWAMKPGNGHLRLKVIAQSVTALVEDEPIDLVVIEGPVTRSQAATVSGMVHGAVLVALITTCVPYVIVPPATLKKFATGKGNADKTAMAIAALKRGGREFADDNQCDSWWLWVAGMTHLGAAPFALPADQVAALDKVEWPT